MPVSIGNRLLMLAAVPVIVLALALLLTFYQQSESMIERQIKLVEADVGDVKKAELKHLMDMTYASIRHIYEQGGSFEEALPILRNLQFGKNGYIFGYRENGDRLLLGNSDKGLGQNFWDLQDKQGNYLIRELLRASKSGDGYFTYWFPKPNETEPSPKTSYSIYLDRWKMFMGTGFYFDDVDEIVAELNADGAENLQSALLKTFFVAVIMLLAAFAGGYLLSLTIRRPISQISRSVDSLASGDADLAARLQVNDRFELGTLADRVNTFIATLATLIKQIKGISTNVSGHSETIAEQTGRMKQIVSEQDMETDQVATAVTQMTAAAVQISQSASEAADAANNSDATANKVRESVTIAASEVGMLADEIVASTARVTELGNGVTEISSVVDVIRNIAEQTNLLALNAAIEAARAGEQGRGFAVVADEVRGLASKTQQSTEEIASMIDRLGKSATDAVDAMAQSNERSGVTLGRAKEAAEAITQIVDSIALISQMNAQIATASEEQTNVCEEITQRLVQIADKANEASAIGSDCNASANALVEASQDLKQLIARFKTD